MIELQNTKARNRQFTRVRPEDVPGYLTQGHVIANHGEQLKYDQYLETRSSTKSKSKDRKGSPPETIGIEEGFSG